MRGMKCDNLGVRGVLEWDRMLLGDRCPFWKRCSGPGFYLQMLVGQANITESRPSDKFHGAEAGLVPLQFGQIRCFPSYLSALLSPSICPHWSIGWL